jgi:hypothetical protein
LASAIDGAFDEDVEDFQFAPVLTSGTHTIQVRAINSVGNVSPIVSDTLTYVPSILDTETFVRQQYLDFLDREPDPGGFSGWVNALDSGLSKADLIEAFMNSGEFRFEGKFIAQSYLGNFDARRRPWRFRGWLAALLAGVSRSRLYRCF